MKEKRTKNRTKRLLQKKTLDIFKLKGNAKYYFFVLSWQDLNELRGFKTNFFLFSKLTNSITMEELQVKYKKTVTNP